MSGRPGPFEQPENTEWRDPVPLPRHTAGVIEQKDGAMLPVYFCLFCECRGAVEGLPATPELIDKYGADATLHICIQCHYIREIEKGAL